MSQSDQSRQLAMESFQRGDYETALEHCGRTLQSSADDAMTWQIRGLCALQLGHFKVSIEALEKTLSLSGDDPEVLNNLGIAKRRDGDIEGAIAAYTQSIRLRSDLAPVHNNLADARVAQGQWSEAITSFRTALMIQPQDASTKFNLANLLRDMGEHEQSLSHYETLVREFPDDAEVKWNAALAYLASGRWRRGFGYYESRFDLKHMDKPPIPKGVPRWRGEGLSGKKILIISEQGFGDLFQMLACTVRLKQLGAEITVQCHPRLHRLIKAAPHVDRVIGETERGIDVDFYEWLMSCPDQLNLESDDVPANESWLVLPEGSPAESWRDLLPKGDKLKVGLNFQGSADFPHDNFRSLALSHFKPVWERKDINLVSIQKGFGEEQLQELPDDAVTVLGHLLDTGDDAFVETAYCLSELDLLITSDTAVAHLAGALGCEVWVMLSTVVDWRWGTKGGACSWYPSMRLFRQRERGEWKPVIMDVMQALDKLVGT
jgi:tetratricopeptide (TPR) repeat protein